MRTSYTFALTVLSKFTGQALSVWIVGHSFIFWAERRALRRVYSGSLNFDPKLMNICWHGRRGMVWENLFEELSSLFQSMPIPDILILHLGGNDIGRSKSLDLLFRIKNDLSQFSQSFPKVRVVFSEIVPRLVWLNSPFEKVRRRLNRAIAKFMPTIGGFSFRHVELEGGIVGLFRLDGVHLSEIGLDIFNNDLQSMVELAARRGGWAGLVFRKIK